MKWKTELSGPGSSTPALWDDAIYLTATRPEPPGVDAIKLNFWTGQIEWTHPICDATSPNRRSDLSGPSPATDGERIIFVTGTGDIVAIDAAGKELWRRDLQKDYGKFGLRWNYSSSPVLTEGRVIIQILHSARALLVALDPSTGEELWQHTRATKAVGAARDAYSSPIPITFRGRSEVLISGGDRLSSHTPSSGQQLWHWGTWNLDRQPDLRTVSSPVYGSERIVICAPKEGDTYAFKAGAFGTIKINKTAWKSQLPELSCDITTPLSYEDSFYFLNGRQKILSRVNPYLGATTWRAPIPSRSKIEASPTGADGKIYMISHTGEIFVVKADEEFELLHSTILGQDPNAKNRAAIVPSKGRLIIRTGPYVWSMGM